MRLSAAVDIRANRERMVGKWPPRLTVTQMVGIVLSETTTDQAQEPEWNQSITAPNEATRDLRFKTKCILEDGILKTITPKERLE